MKYFKEDFSILYLKYLVFFQLVKPSLTLRGDFHLGGVLFKSKEKHLKHGEKISNLEDASCNFYSYTFDYLQKTLKRFFKRICKNKTSGASVVQTVI
jgi:hypothetical protein